MSKDFANLTGLEFYKNQKNKPTNLLSIVVSLQKVFPYLRFVQLFFLFKIHVRTEMHYTPDKYFLENIKEVISNLLLSDAVDTKTKTKLKRIYNRIKL